MNREALGLPAVDIGSCSRRVLMEPTVLGILIEPAVLLNSGVLIDPTVLGVLIEPTVLFDTGSS